MELRVTQAVEKWASERRRQVAVSEFSTFLAVFAVSVGLAVALFSLLGGSTWPFLLVPVVGLTGLAVAGARMRSRWVSPHHLARKVDLDEDTHGLLQAAMAVEQGRAYGSPDLAQMVQTRAVDLMPTLDDKVSPSLVLPILPIVVAMLALVLGALVAAVVPLLPRPADIVPDDIIVEAGDGPDETLGLEPETMQKLAALAESIEHVASSPGLDPVAADALRDALEHVENAMASRGDAREAVVAMARAQRELDRAVRSGLHSEEALASVPRNELAKGLRAAMERGDAVEARRLAEELTRRTETSSDLDMWNTGKALQDQLEAAAAESAGMGEAKSAAERAAQAMGTGRRGDALGALADLLAELGEAAAYQPSGKQLMADVEAEMDQARRDELQNIDAADRAARSAAESDGPKQEGDNNKTDGEADDPDSSGDAPVGFGAEGADGDGKGPKAGPQGDDAADGGTPSPGAPGDPLGEVGGARPDAARSEGAPADDPNRFVAGDGEAQEGDDGATGSAGQGTGTPGGSEDLASTPGPGGKGDEAGAMSGAGPGSGLGGNGEPPPVPALAGVDPETVHKEWIASQWSGASDSMGELVRRAAEGDHSSQEWGQVHARYAALAEAAARQEAIPLTRRAYIRRYFEAIRTETP